MFFLFLRNESQCLYGPIHLLYHNIENVIYEHSATEEKLTCLRFKFYKSLNDYGTEWENALIVLARGLGI